MQFDISSRTVYTESNDFISRATNLLPAGSWVCRVRRSGRPVCILRYNAKLNFYIYLHFLDGYPSEPDEPHSSAMSEGIPDPTAKCLRLSDQQGGGQDRSEHISRSLFRATHGIVFCSTVKRSKISLGIIYSRRSPNAKNSKNSPIHCTQKKIKNIKNKKPPATVYFSCVSQAFNNSQLFTPR